MQNNNIIFYNEIDSTSAELHRLLRDNTLPHGYCIITDYQTNGHGQASNRWESENAQNLLFSILLHPTAIPPSRQFIITEIVTMAITLTLKDEISDEISIKWPNDIYIGNKKVCGILIENSICGNRITNCIIGVGINVNQSVFTSDAPNPVSLKQISGKKHERKIIIEKIYNNILDIYNNISNPDNQNNTQNLLHQYYMNHLYRRNGYHKYSDSKGHIFYGKIDHIDQQGFLYLKDKDTNQTLQFAFKEVKFLL